MQYSLFTPNSCNTEESQFDENDLFPAVDERRKALEESLYTKWHCVREILYTEYLWDMRCWHKPKFEYTQDEIKEHITKWLSDHEMGRWTNNCGHCLYCIRKLLVMQWATLDEIAGFVMRNNTITYPNTISTWAMDEDEETDDTEQASDCAESNHTSLEKGK